MARSATRVFLSFLTLIANGVWVEALEEQPYRTAFHFQPPRNWMNGPMYYNGVYHLFYQSNPNSPTFGLISWAHSVSYNLVDWTHIDPALNPSEPYDINGCWSGSVTLLPPENSHPAVLYTGIDSLNRQVQNLATPKNLSDPFLTEWTKSPRNPLILPPDNIDPQSFRDPTTAWRGPDNKWRVLIGSMINGGGAAVLYKSTDFVSWEMTNLPLHSSNGTGMWECPDFYPAGGSGRTHVLKVSFDSRDYYSIGNYNVETDVFEADVDLDKRLSYDYGVFYASKTFHDTKKNRRVLWGWVRENDTESSAVARGWSGLQSIPRTVFLDKNRKQLIQWPIEEVEKLRGEKVGFDDREIKSGELVRISGVTASQADVEVSFLLKKSKGVEVIKSSFVDAGLMCREMNATVEGLFGPFGLMVLASEDLSEKTAIFFRVFQSSEGKHVVLMCCDQSRSSVNARVEGAIFGSFLDVDPYEEISLRTLIDHSIVESFGGKGKSCITARVYPKLAVFENSRIYAFNHGKGSVVISSLSAWSMKGARIVQAR